MTSIRQSEPLGLLFTEELSNFNVSDQFAIGYDEEGLSDKENSIKQGCSNLEELISKMVKNTTTHLPILSGSCVDSVLLASSQQENVTTTQIIPDNEVEETCYYTDEEYNDYVSTDNCCNSNSDAVDDDDSQNSDSSVCSCDSEDSDYNQDQQQQQQQQPQQVSVSEIFYPSVHPQSVSPQFDYSEEEEDNNIKRFSTRKSTLQCRIPAYNVENIINKMANFQEIKKRIAGAKLVNVYKSKSTTTTTTLIERFPALSRQEKADFCEYNCARKSVVTNYYKSLADLPSIAVLGSNYLCESELSKKLELCKGKVAWLDYQVNKSLPVTNYIGDKDNMVLCAGLVHQNYTEAAEHFASVLVRQRKSAPYVEKYKLELMVWVYWQLDVTDLLAYDEQVDRQKLKSLLAYLCKQVDQDQVLHDELIAVCEFHNSIRIPIKALHFIKTKFAQLYKIDADRWSYFAESLGIHHYVCDHTWKAICESYVQTEASLVNTLVIDSFCDYRNSGKLSQWFPLNLVDSDELTRLLKPMLVKRAEPFKANQALVKNVNKLLALYCTLFVQHLDCFGQLGHPIFESHFEKYAEKYRLHRYSVLNDGDEYLAWPSTTFLQNIHNYLRSLAADILPTRDLKKVEFGDFVLLGKYIRKLLCHACLPASLDDVYFDEELGVELPQLSDKRINWTVKDYIKLVFEGSEPGGCSDESEADSDCDDEDYTLSDEEPEEEEEEEFECKRFPEMVVDKTPIDTVLLCRWCEAMKTQPLYQITIRDVSDNCDMECAKSEVCEHHSRTTDDFATLCCRECCTQLAEHAEYRAIVYSRRHCKRPRGLLFNKRRQLYDYDGYLQDKSEELQRLRGEMRNPLFAKPYYDEYASQGLHALNPLKKSFFKKNERYENQVSAYSTRARSKTQISKSDHLTRKRHHSAIANNNTSGPDSNCPAKRQRRCKAAVIEPPTNDVVKHGATYRPVAVNRTYQRITDYNNRLEFACLQIHKRSTKCRLCGLAATRDLTIDRSPTNIAVCMPCSIVLSGHNGLIDAVQKHFQQNTDAGKVFTCSPEHKSYRVLSL